MVGGFGLGLMYVPAVVAVGYWFEKRRSLVTGRAWRRILYRDKQKERDESNSCSTLTNSLGHLKSSFYQGQDSCLKMRTFLKPASLGYGVNKQY